MNEYIQPQVIIPALSGLIGAIIGGIISVYASKTQHITEFNTVQRSALMGLLTEVWANQAFMIGDLDRVLPLWLSRVEDGITLRKLTKNSVTLRYRIYDSFFKELIASKLGSLVEVYYERIAILNKIPEGEDRHVQIKDFQSYVQNLSLAIEVGDDLFHDITKEYPKDILKWSNRNDYVGSFTSNREHSLQMAAMFRTKTSELRDYLQAGKATGMASQVRNLPKEVLEIWYEYSLEYYQ